MWQSVGGTALALTACACSAPSGNVGASHGNASGGSTGTSAGGSGASIFGGGGSTPQFNTPQGGGSSSGPDDGGCTGVTNRAEKRAGGKADIIFVLDNSGSMTEEAVAVQVNMNDFSQLIASSGIDAHVVVISSGPPAGQSTQCDLLDFACWASIGGSFSSNGVCVDPPLGMQGACPNGDDTNLAAGYMHWRESVGSHDALAKIQSTFSGWQVMLRPDAAKTFVVVTDDENNAPPTAADFTAWVDSQPVFASALWRFSGVFCVTNSANCANIGATYDQLVKQTGGIEGDLAQFSTGNIDAQFASVFSSLADAVVADAVPVQCEWLIPPPPDGQTLDPNLVNVKFTHGDGTSETIYGVEQPACPPSSDFLAWYYDDPVHPQRVIACGDTCPVLQADDSAEIQVQFGCAREDPPIR